MKASRHSEMLIEISSRSKHVDASAYLSGLVSKLKDSEFIPGVNRLIVYPNGSLQLNGEIVWEPKVLNIRKAG